MICDIERVSWYLGSAAQCWGSFEVSVCVEVNFCDLFVEFVTRRVFVPTFVDDLKIATSCSRSLINLSFRVCY